MIRKKQSRADNPEMRLPARLFFVEESMPPSAEFLPDVGYRCRESEDTGNSKQVSG